MSSHLGSNFSMEMRDRYLNPSQLAICSEFFGSPLQLLIF